MSIVLRVNKGSALTYHEMDRNQSSFFYSSSLDPTGTKMRLFYTGSSALNESGLDFAPDRYQEIPFPTAPEINIPEAVAAGSNSQIQFNDDGSFGADTLFTFNKDKNSMGIGGNPDSSYKITVTAEQSRPANIGLRGLSTVEAAQKANLEFIEDSNVLGSIGRTNINDQHIYFGHTFKLNGGTEFGKINISITDDQILSNSDAIVGTFTKLNNGDKTFGVGTQSPNRNISVAGTPGLGISVAGIAENESYLQPLYGDILNATDSVGSFFIPASSNPAGLLISSPNGNEGGNVVLNVNTDSSQKEAFNIVSTQQSDFSTDRVSDNTACMLASFRVDGKHGINTQRGSVTGLNIVGNVSSSGYVSIGTVPDEETVGDVTVIGVDAVGKVHKSKAAPVPIGGIIMWSGAVDTLPAGFYLCDGDNGTPDLRDRFIAGASNTSGAPTTTVSGSSAVTSASPSYTPTGTLTITKLTKENIPPHHHFFVGDDNLYNGMTPANGSSGDNSYDNVGGTGATGTQAGLRQIFGYDADSSNSGGDKRRLFRTSDNNASSLGTSDSVMTIAITEAPTGIFTGESVTVVPPYYALAFIMYKG